MRWMRFPRCKQAATRNHLPGCKSADLIRPSGTFPLQKGKALKSLPAGDTLFIIPFHVKHQKRKMFHMKHCKLRKYLL